MTYMTNRCLITYTVLVHYGNVLPVSAAVNQSQQSSIYKQFAGWTIWQQPYLTEIVSNKIRCVSNCIQMSECLSVDYMTKSNSCSYFTTAIYRFRPDSDHTVIVNGNTPGVALHAGYSSYSYTYHQAGEACSSLSGRRMTYQELLTLYNNGYQQCSCGWIEGGGRYYPMQTSHERCGGDTGLLDYSWAVLAHAWCMLE